MHAGERSSFCPLDCVFNLPNYLVNLHENYSENRQVNCGNLPQSDRQTNFFLRTRSYRRPDSFGHSWTDKQTPSVKQAPHSERRQYLYTAAHGRSHATNTGPSQPAPTTSAPPPTGPHATQQQRNKNAGLRQASISSISTISISSTSRSSALGESLSRQQPHLRGQQLYAP
jgi:hypothetical protein